MSLQIDNGIPVHLPADPAKFAFDREVSAIFPDMAVRSIPNFLEAHAAHSRMLRAWANPGLKVLDVGASRGAFAKALMNEFPLDYAAGKIKVTAVDNSPDMCGHLKLDHPEIDVRCEDISEMDTRGMRGFYDVVCVNYVLQFLPPEKQIITLLRLYSLVRVGGVFILGHKSMHGGMSGDASHEEYLRFREHNGYSREEIAAKTAALKGSMHPMNHAMVMQTLHNNFSEVTETFRFMMFSAVFAVK